MANFVSTIFMEIQHSKSNHPKQIITFVNYLKREESEENIEAFWNCLKCIFQCNINQISSKVLNALEFAVKVCVECFKLPDPYMVSFFESSIHNVLNCFKCAAVEPRYFACSFVNLFLHNDLEIDIDLWNKLEDVLLERLNDKVVKIRVEAVMGLSKLQNPTNPECRVISAYITHLRSSSALLRKEIIKSLAPNKKSLPYIVMKVRDVDKFVRLAAYDKCAKINPKFLRFCDRHSILNSGFYEDDATVQQHFISKLIPKWLSVYDDNFLTFLNSLNLDVDENSVEKTDYVMRNLMSVVFKNCSVNDVLNALPLNENKFIKHHLLSNDTANYWNLVIKYLMSIGDEDNLQKILPDICIFCKELEKLLEDYVPDKCVDPTKKQTFYYLLETITLCDLCEEAGRQAVNNLMAKILLQFKVDVNLTDKILNILNKTHESEESFFMKVMEIVTKLQEVGDKKPIVQKEPDTYEINKLKCKFATFENEQELAINNKDYKLAKKLEDDMQEVKKQISAMTDLSSEPNTHADSLEKRLLILISYMKMKDLKVLPAEINEFKENYANLDSEDKTLYKTVFTFIIQCAIIDEETAKKYLERITIPIIAYRSLWQYEKDTFLLSITAAADLMLLFGTDIFSNQSSGNSLRPLYKGDTNDALFDFNSVTAGYVIDTLLQILNDEDKDVSNCAGFAILRLIINNVAVSHSLLTRIILAWFNPAKEAESAFQQSIGLALKEYASSVPNSDTVLEQCVIPVLTTVANAPKTSPLSDIDVALLIKFLAVISNEASRDNKTYVHVNIANCILRELHLTNNYPEAVLLCRMLLALNMPEPNSTAREDLKKLVEQILAEHGDSPIAALLQKYCANLSGTNTKAAASESQAPCESAILTSQIAEEVDDFEEITNAIASASIDNNNEPGQEAESGLKRTGPATKQRKEKKPKVESNYNTRSSSLRSDSRCSSSTPSQSEKRNKRSRKPSAATFSTESTDVVEKSTDSDTSQTVRRSKRRRNR